MIATTRKSDRAAGWRVVMAAYFGVMTGFGSLLVFSFGTFLKPLTAEFGWSREAVSAAFTFGALTVAVCSPVLGRLLDRHSPRRVVVPCVIVFATAFASLAVLRPPIWHLYATFVVLGIVGNGTSQMGYSRAVSTWFDKRRGLALALVMAGSGTGSIVFPPLAQTLIDHYGWRAAYATLAAMVLVFGLPLAALFLKEREHAAGEPAATSGIGVRASLRSSIFWILIGTLLLGSLAVNGALTHLSPMLTDRGLPAQQAALVASALGFSSFIGRLVTGALLDRFFGPRVAFAVTAGTALGVLLLASAASLASAFFAAMFIGLGMGAEADITPYLLTRYFGLRSFSTLYGFSWTAYAIAGGAGPVLMGRVFDATGSYAALLRVLAGSLVASAALFLALPRYASGEPCAARGELENTAPLRG